MYGLKKRSKQDESGLIQGAGTGTSDDVNSYGIIEYDFDLFGQHQVDVRLYGNAEVV